MTDLSISDLTNYWNGFQERFEKWNRWNRWFGTDGSNDACSRLNINRFCNGWSFTTEDGYPGLHFGYFPSDDCETYCVNNNYCRLYWTKQAKICCEKCDQTCTSMGESVVGECWTPTTTTTTTTRIPSTTTKNPVTTSSFTTTNGTSYTKQPFGKSPFISLPIVAGLLFIFIAIYLLRRRIKLSLNMSTGDRSDDSLRPSISVDENETMPNAPATDDETNVNEIETNIHIVSPLDTQFSETAEPTAPPNDSPPAYHSAYGTLNIEKPPEYLEIFAKKQSETNNSVSGNNSECTICFEHVNVNRKWTAFVPCGHRICQPCSVTISAPSGGPCRNICPICRKSIKQYLILEGIYDE